MNKFAPFIIGALVLLALIVYFTQSQSNPKYWQEDYDTDANKPYDIRILYQLLEGRFDLKVMEERIPQTLSLESNHAANTSYLYLSRKAPEYTEEEAWHLRDYVRNGGQAFIIAPNLSDSLAELLLYPEDCGGNTTWQGKDNPRVYETQVLATLSHPNLPKEYYRFNFMNLNYIEQSTWTYIPKEAFCDTRAAGEYVHPDTKRLREYALAKLGTFQVIRDTGNSSSARTFVNFVRMQVGEGYFYFHTNPIMFTNLYLVDSAGFEYSNYVFSHLQNTTLYWDRQSVLLPNKSKASRKTMPKVAAQSPLEYIFAQPALRWSWYIVLGLAATYVLFGAKRRQRIIPILEPNRNTSLEFIETIGSLYFQQQDHKGIINKQMHLFLAHMRQRYHLVTSEIDDRLVNRISVRARVDRKIVEAIFTEYKHLSELMQKRPTTITAQMLNDFYVLIEQFHIATRTQERVHKE